MGLNEESEARLLRFLGRLGVYALLAFGMLYLLFELRGILAPFMAAFLLALALAPVVDRLEARGLPRWLATTVVYALVFGTLTGMVVILFPIVKNQIGEVVTDLRGRFRLDQPADITRTMTEQIRIFGRRNSVPSFVLQPIVQQAKNSASLLTKGLESFSALLVRFIPNLIWFIVVPIVSFYALIDYHRIYAKALLLCPKDSRDGIRAIASEVSDVFGKYLRGLLLVCFLDTVATICVLFWFAPTKPYCAALGLIAGVFYAVPYIGALVSTSLIAVVAFASPAGGSPAYLLSVTISMVLLHQVFFDQVVTPRLLGGQVGLHPILSILALAAGSTLLGIGGMLIAVPFAASIQVIVVHVLPRLSRRVQLVLPPGETPPESAPAEPPEPPPAEPIESAPTAQAASLAAQASPDK
jgi:predicted PurR-regulated permease PerM